MDHALREAIADPERVKVLFADEANFYRQPTQAWLWAGMGRRQPKVPYSAGTNTVMRVLGLMDSTSARVHVWDFQRITADRVARCFRGISSLYPDADKIYLVMDNWPVHLHPKVQKVLKAQDRIRVVLLPTYSPWLNNIEKLWRWVRHQITHVHPWSQDFVVFRHQVLAEFERLQPGLPELKRYCGLDSLI